MPMLSPVLLTIAAAISPVAVAADAVAPDPVYAIDRSAVLTVRSDLGEDYRVFAAWPEEAPPARGWPVLYLLDGDDQFATFVVTARRLARAAARSGVGPGVIVAIGAGPLARRVRDYTPEAGADAIPIGAPAHGFVTGGADAFLTFVAARIRPEVERRWRIDGSRQTLAGHSFGGLAALYDMQRFGHFGRYAAISPSLWYGKGAVVRRVESSAKLSDKRVLLAQDDVERDSAASLEKLGAALAAGGAQVQTLPLAGQNHGSTMNAAIVQSVTFAFGKEKRP